MTSVCWFLNGYMKWLTPITIKNFVSVSGGGKAQGVAKGERSNQRPARLEYMSRLLVPCVLGGARQICGKRLVCHCEPANGWRGSLNPWATRDCFVGLRPPHNDIRLPFPATFLSYTHPGRHRQTRLTVLIRPQLTSRGPTGKRVCPCHPSSHLPALNRCCAC